MRSLFNAGSAWLLALVVFVLAGAVVVTDGRAQLLDANLEPVFYALPDNVEVLRLENGLEVVLHSNPASPMVGVFTQVKVGSAWEDYRTSGMSHMLEHLLFNGSEKYTQDEQYDLADRAGAYNNANTSDFYTNFMMVLPAQELETGLDLQSQMLFHSALPEDKFEKEKGIVLGEIVQQRDWPGHATETALRQTVYQGSSLELAPIGTRSTIEHMQRDDVYEFYKTWYVPNNMVLSLMGNFDRDRAVALLEQYFGTPAPGPLGAKTLHPAPHIERTETTTRRAGDERVLALVFEAPTYGMADYFPFLVGTELLDLAGSGILTRALEILPENLRPDFGAYWQAAPGFGRLTLQFDLKDATDPTTLYRLVQDAVSSALNAGIDGEDILGIVRMSETETLLQREQLRMTGVYIAEPMAVGGVDFYLSFLERLREVTTEDVSRVLAGWLLDAPCRAVLVEPLAGRQAADDDSAGGMQLPEGMQVPPAMLEALKKQGMSLGGDTAKASEPGSEAPAEPAVAAPLQVDRSVLANGAVLVSQTNADSPLMAIHLVVRGRAMIDRDDAQAGAVDLVHRLLEEGYAGCDRACLAQRLRGLGAKVKLVDDARIPMDDYYTNGRFSFIRIETTATNGADVLTLLAEEIQHASFDDAAFERIRRQRSEALDREQASARQVANRLLDETLYGDHPLVLPPEGDVASLAALDFDQVRRVYRKIFSPENLIFSVVGPLSHDDLKTQLEDLLPGRGQPAPGIPPLPVTATPQRVTATVGGELTAIRIGSVLAVPAADAAALQLVTAILSDRLAMDLRETRGLSYAAGAVMSVHGERGEFTAWLNPPRERLAEGEEALRDFVAQFDAATITQAELDKIRSARTGRMMMRRLSSMGQAYYLAMAELDDDIPGYLGALTAYDDLTLADLQRAATTYLQTMNLVTVVVD